MLTLLKQGKGFFHIGASGHEAAQVGLGMHLKGGHDWFCMYYRDLALTLTLGMTARRHDARPLGEGRRRNSAAGARCPSTSATASSTS